MMLKKHYVTFLSPGTFTSEQTTKEIHEWDVQYAVQMSTKIEERYNAKPYGFYFTTRGREEDEMDSKEITRSKMYFLGGNVQTLQEVKDRNDPNDSILITNMECNGWDRIIVNTNSYKITLPLNKDDVVLEI